MTKINLRNTAKFHAHLHTLTKTLVKFQKDPDKVAGVAFTRLDMICNGQSNGRTGKNNMSPDPEGGGGGDIFTQYAKSLNQRVIMFWVSFNSDGSFEYPQHMFLLRNKKNNFQLCILIWGPDMVEISECEHYHD